MQAYLSQHGINSPKDWKKLNDLNMKEHVYPNSMPKDYANNYLYATIYWFKVLSKEGTNNNENVISTLLNNKVERVNHGPGASSIFESAKIKQLEKNEVKDMSKKDKDEFLTELGLRYATVADEIPVIPEPVTKDNVERTIVDFPKKRGRPRKVRPLPNE